MMFNRFKAPKSSYTPFKITVGYVAITFLLSVIGPVKYLRYEYEYWKVLLYLTAVFIFMGFGYFLGIFSPDKLREVEYDGWYRTERLLRRSTIIALVSLVLEVFYLASTGNFHIGFSDLGGNYFQDISGSSVIMIFRFATDFFRVASCVLGFYFFNRIDRKLKVRVIIVALLIFSVTMFGYGQQKSIGDLFIYFAVAIFVKNLKAGKHLSKKTKRIIVILGVIVLFLLAFIQSQRYKLIGVTAYNYSMRGTGEIGYNTNSILFKIFGDDLGFGLAVILTSYLSMGYYGLSLCMKLPFEWTYGVGGSRALTSLLQKIGINGIEEKTYLSRLGDTFGRNGLASWNTIFPWLASDLTYFGVLFYFAVVGYIMAQAWRDVLRYNNAISFLMFSILSIMVFYIPANNQIFHSYGSFVSTICTIILWLFVRRYYNVID